MRSWSGSRVAARKQYPDWDLPPPPAVPPRITPFSLLYLSFDGTPDLHPDKGKSKETEL